MERKRRKLVFADGSVMEGYAFGYHGDVVCPLVFNTAMIGYQEVLTSPAYAAQGVVMTYPIIGNYGTNEDDYETKEPSIGALIVRDYNDQPSNFRYTKSLGEIMEEHRIPGLYGIDTRMLTRKLRDNGACIAMLTDAETPVEAALAAIAEYEAPTDLVKRVSCAKKWYSRIAHACYNVVVIDCGVDFSCIKALKARECNVTVVPYNATAEQILALNPDGVFVSSGPGNPKCVPETAATVKELAGKCPIFAIGLGCLVAAIAYGADTEELKCGKHGGNHPVRNTENGKIEIVNHGNGYVINADSLARTDLEITHTYVLDGTVAGIECKRDNLFGVQYHPETAPGHRDNSYLLDKFANKMEEYRNAKKN